jgi:hypothetical protein
MSKWALGLVPHVDILTFENNKHHAQRLFGHWTFLVGYWTFTARHETATNARAPAHYKRKGSACCAGWGKEF